MHHLYKTNSKQENPENLLSPLRSKCPKILEPTTNLIKSTFESPCYNQNNLSCQTTEFQTINTLAVCFSVLHPIFLSMEFAVSSGQQIPWLVSFLPQSCDQHSLPPFSLMKRTHITGPICNHSRFLIQDAIKFQFSNLPTNKKESQPESISKLKSISVRNLTPGLKKIGNVGFQWS